MDRHHAGIAGNCTLHTGYTSRYVADYIPYIAILTNDVMQSTALLLNTSTGSVRPLLHSHRSRTDISPALIIVSMGAKLGAVLIYAPVFIIGAAIVAIVGGFFGQMYMSAQLPVKREMANAKAPVLGVFGGAIAGLSRSISLYCSIRRAESSIQRPLEHTALSKLS